MIKKWTICISAALLSAGLLCSCATQYETKTLTNFVDRSTVEQKPAEEITSQIADIETMNKDKQLNIKIALEIADETPAFARPQGAKAGELQKDALSLAMNYLSRIKAYKVIALPPNAPAEMAADIDFQYVIQMRIVFSAEREEKYNHDETMYKTSIDWKLIDNRGDVPVVREALTCKNVTARKTAIAGLSGKRMGGSNKANLINAYRNTLENSLIEFRAQLANRIPFGGRVISMRVRDDKVMMNINVGIDGGIQNRMQMLILNEDGDKVCIGQVSGSAKGNQATIEVYRWLSESLKKEMVSLAANRSKAIKYLKEEGNRLYAISLGMPTPSKDERTQIDDFK